MKDIYFDFATAFLASISALLWLLSARVNFDSRFDPNQYLTEAMRKASRLNASAATVAAVAAVIQAAKPAYGVFLGFAA
jgi:hypothetical protein